MPIVTIASDVEIDIEEHFKLSAGPGAGKTFWLVKHIKNVLQNSTRLNGSKKIACITYTNVGVGTILSRLDFMGDKVEVSTIHAFIYKNIVKPYIHFIAEEFCLNASKIDGHDDHFPSRKMIEEWVNNHVNVAQLTHPYSVNQISKFPNNLKAIKSWLNSLKYNFENGQLTLKADNSKAFYYDNDRRKNLSKANCLDKLSAGFMDYKKLFWKKGILHHEDVLFFGHTLLKRYPFILRIIQIKYGYFFIDEFQDTNPIQAAILEMIACRDTIIGVIGDKAQSIYSFQGASPIFFEQFSLPELKIYEITDNRRSTKEIVKLLNQIRGDLQQIAIRGVDGAHTQLLIGDLDTCFKHSIEIQPEQGVATLCWDNITSNAMKRRLNVDLPPCDLITDLSEKDNNSIRRKVVINSLTAVEFARDGQFKAAIKEMEKNFYCEKDPNVKKSVALKSLLILLANYPRFIDMSFIEFYTLVKNNIRGDLSNLRKGGALDFYSNYSYGQMAVCVTNGEEFSLNRTIHKSKGDEFHSVFLILKSEKDLAFLINSDLDNEKHRLYYVAASRARQQLFISVPTLTAEHEKRLNGLLDIIRL